MSRPTPPQPDVSFEEALARLEEAVAALETGELDLASSLARFEEAMALARACEQHLQQAERKLEQLTESGPEAWSPETGDREPNG